ncbi:hypothetical protein BJY04DRAFT_219615 [Aspergillus karnatakaensis]|uniref:uncharacterized protein n=1 Tax=Aspergillus karnatakaensis TaxID=1810916 RepID=UPI003CCE0010
MGNVAMTRMREAMVTLLPSTVGEGSKARSKGAQYSAYGDRLVSRIPYTCELVSFAYQNLMVIDYKTPQDTAQGGWSMNDTVESNW